MYHNHASRVAPSTAFREAIRRAAGVAMHARTLTAQDSQLLRDLRRAEGRYQFRAIDRLFDLLANVPEDAPALALVEEMRAAIIARRRRNAARDLRSDAVQEIATARDADVAIAILLSNPHPDLAVIQRAIAATATHRHGIDRLLDDLYCERYALAHGAR